MKKPKWSVPTWGSRGVAALILVFGLLSVLPRFAALQAQAPTLPDNVETRAVVLWSDGTRLAGDLFYPTGTGPESKRPAILLTHGWGGVRSHLNRGYAPYFAAAGYVVLTFDYRGWGDSDSRLVLKGKLPELNDKGEATVKVHAIRELVDPFDQTEDIRNALYFLEGEPGVDAERIGLWGTSYSGGHSVWVAAHDRRVRAVVAQVGSMDSIGSIKSGGLYTGGLEGAHARQVDRVRGEVDPVPQGVDQVAGLRGTPYISRMAHYSPVAVAHRLEVPILIMDAGNEELFDIREHGQKVYEIVKDKVPARYHVFEGITHYQVYSNKRREALAMAIEWFDKHLKGDGSS